MNDTLRQNLSASVLLPDEITLYGTLRDAAEALAGLAEAVRQAAIRGERPSLEKMLSISVALHLADQATLSYARARGIAIKPVADLC